MRKARASWGTDSEANTSQWGICVLSETHPQHGQHQSCNLFLMSVRIPFRGVIEDFTVISTIASQPYAWPFIDIMFNFVVPETLSLWTPTRQRFWGGDSSSSDSDSDSDSEEEVRTLYPQSISFVLEKEP